MYETIDFEMKDDVALLTLNRPDRLNAFTAQMNREIVNVCKEVAYNEQIRALLITGAGRAFCSGEDLASVSGAERVNHGDVLRQRYNPMIEAIYRLEKPTVAAINGAAAGAGMSLALACDFRIAADNANLVEAFIHIGLIPDSGSCYFLPRIVGLAKALELAVLGDKISAEQAYQIGLVTKVVQANQLQEEALAFARKLAAMPTKAIGLIKRTIFHGLNHSLKETLEYEAYAQEIAGQTNDHHEGVQAFMEKRKPVFRGK